MAAPTAQHPTEIAPGLSSTELAVDRTRLAHDRTMMAWVRTATSLITFGFSVYKFFQMGKGEGGQNKHLIGPREFGLLMISIGLVSLLLATLQDRRNMRALREHYPNLPGSLAALVAVMVAILGILALLTVILRQ